MVGASACGFSALLGVWVFFCVVAVGMIGRIGLLSLRRGRVDDASETWKQKCTKRKRANREREEEIYRIGRCKLELLSIAIDSLQVCAKWT